MISEILNALSNIFGIFLTMIGLRSGENIPIGPNILRVFIKQAGKTISADLDPSWSIEKVRQIVGPKLGISPNEFKIIFAGRELPDNLILKDCDIGQQSFLHAVQIVKKSSPPINADFVKNEKVDDDGVDDLSSSSTSLPLPQTSNHSDYFVYCNTCQDLNEGKLRVRCSNCLSGAFMVLRDPENWEDVLISKRVEGSCSTPNCIETFAQFYFKCASHVTRGEDDSAPPLSLIKRNRELVPCLACGDEKEIVLVFQCPDKHVTCIDCFKQYILSKINSRQFILDSIHGYSVGCPALCRDSLILDSNHFKLMGRYDYERYQKFATEECLIQMQGLMCPQPGCGMGIIPIDTNCNKIACLHGCGYVFCKLCLEGWHIGPCQENTQGPYSVNHIAGASAGPGPISLERAAQAQWDDVNRKALRITTKPCPSCRSPTERIGGCMHMECFKCHFQWCWICQNAWTRSCMGNHWFG